MVACQSWQKGYCHTFYWNSLVFATGICPGISRSMQTSMVMSWRVQCRTFSIKLQKLWCVSALSAFKMHVFLTTSTQYLPDLQIDLQIWEICLLDLLRPDYAKENQSEMLRHLSGSSEQQRNTGLLLSDLKISDALLTVNDTWEDNLELKSTEPILKWARVLIFRGLSLELFDPTSYNYI